MLRRLSMATVVVIGASLSLSITPVDAVPRKKCGDATDLAVAIVDCWRTAVIQGTPPDAGEPGAHNSDSQGSQMPQGCGWIESDGISDHADDPVRWRASNYQDALSFDRGSGDTLMGLWCDGRDGQRQGFHEWQIWGEDVVEPGPSAALLADRLLARLEVPAPEVEFGPDPLRVAVKVPVLISLPGVTSVTDSISAAGLTVTMVATLEQVVLGMGEPDVRGTFNRHRPEVEIVCDAAQITGPSGGPECSYTYIWKSTSERTGGTCEWPVSATATWGVRWTADNGESGNLSLDRSSATSILVREWRTQLVSPQQFDRDRFEQEQDDAPCR